MTALIDVLFQLEKQLGLELDSLMPIAELDDIGGYHPDETQRKWGAGAIWDVEGKVLNALIRALKPQTIIEIGSGTGCSTTHMASALRDNGGGHITTIDRGNTPQIPDDLKSYVDIRNDDAINYLALQPDNSIDFLLEDADHTTELCHAIGELAKTKLKPGGVLLIHDIEHFAVGAAVRAGYDLAGMEVRRYRADPSDCGWGAWQKPNRVSFAVGGVEVAGFDIKPPPIDDNPVIDTTVMQAQEDYPPEIEKVIDGLTNALHDDESTEDKLKDFHPAPAKKRTRKPKAKPSK